MKIFVLGSNGMLGRYITSYLKRNYNVFTMTRQDVDIEKSDITDFSNWYAIQNCDRDVMNNYRAIADKKYYENVIINCAGLIKQKITDADTAKAIKINSIFPHIMEYFCRRNYINFIHISTDCCFAGTKGNYIETDIPDADDMYGITKIAGEPANATVIRTSIIGEGDFKGSLLEWVKSNNGGNINGFTNHLWNGVTCLQLAKAIEQIITNKSYWRGVRHYFSETVTKAQLVRDIAEVYGLDIRVTDCEANIGVDRTLGTIYKDTSVKAPSIISQIKEQKDFLI